MPSNPPIPYALDDVVAEIASILAQGYLRHRKRRPILPESGGEERKDEDSQVVTEKRLDSSGHRSLHSGNELTPPRRW